MLVGLAEGAAGGGMAAGAFATAATPAGPFLVVVSVKAVATGSALMASGAGHVVSGAQAMFAKGAGSDGTSYDKQKNTTPANNQAQNKQIDDISKQLRLTKGQRRELHDYISKQGYSYQEILEIARDMFGR